MCEIMSEDPQFPEQDAAILLHLVQLCCATHFSLTHSMLEMIFNNFLYTFMIRNTPMTCHMCAGTCEHTLCAPLVSPLYSQLVPLTLSVFPQP